MSDTPNDAPTTPENVIDFPGVTLLDIPPDKMLTAALGRLETVLIIGYTIEGAEYFASSVAAGPEILWQLERARLKLLSVVDNAD